MKRFVILVSILLSSCAGMEDMVNLNIKMTSSTEASKGDPLELPSTSKIDFGGPITTLDIAWKGDRIKINGKSYIDHSGELESMVTHSDTGFITTVHSKQVGDKKVYSLKLNKPFKQYKKKILAEFVEADGAYQFRVKGAEETIVTSYRLMSKGAILFHGTAYFSILTENGLSDPMEIPEGYLLSPLQAKDLSKAHFLIFIKDVGPVMFGFMQVGGKRLYDMQFIDTRTGKIRSISRLALNVESQSAFDTHLRNMVNLRMTDDGLVVLALEADYKNLYARNLHTGSKASLFFREKGIAWFKSGKNSDQRIWVKAAVGFEDKEIDDVLSFMSSANKVSRLGDVSLIQ